MNNEEECWEGINERADKCHEPETHDEFAWSDVNTCKLGEKRRWSSFQKMQVYKEGTRPKGQGRDGKDADQGQVD